MLSVVGTPIGNLGDLSVRQAETIMGAHILLTEDTRSTGLLLNAIAERFPFVRNPEQRLISFHKENEFDRTTEALELIGKGLDVVLMSQAGMPLISDPGYFLVRQVIDQGLPFTVIPGPTAVATALVHSGFEPSRYMFLGFLPKKENELAKTFRMVEEVSKVAPKTVFVAYESPLRIIDTLTAMDAHHPGWKIAVCRELTKKFETIVRGTPHDALGHAYKGEIVIVISP